MLASSSAAEVYADNIAIFLYFYWPDRKSVQSAKDSPQRRDRLIAARTQFDGVEAARNWGLIRHGNSHSADGSIKCPWTKLRRVAEAWTPRISNRTIASLHYALVITA